MFEVFAGQIYSSSLLSDLTVGGARYISTGRGFATSRIPFSILYSRFAGSAIYMGARCMLMLLMGSVAHWQAPLLWFWASLTALMFSPFIFNPHQFSWQDFFLDYRDFIRWLSRGNNKYHRNSWIGYVRMSRSRVTGFKRKLVGDESEKGAGDAAKAHKSNMILADIIPCAIYAAGCFVAFTFINAQTGVKDADLVNSTLRIIICTLAPIAVDMGVLFFCVGMSCCSGPLFGMCCKRTGSVMAGIAHTVAVVVHVVFFIIMWLLESFNFARTLAGVATCLYCQRLIFKVMTVFMLTREFKNDHANTAFWTGKWYGGGLGYMAWTQPTREFVAKVVELSHFAGDFVLGHFILFCQLPVLCIPMIDKFHSIMLFWLKPSRQIRPPIYSLKQTRLRKRMVRKYCALYFIVLAAAVACIIGPAVASGQTKRTPFADQTEKIDPVNMKWLVNIVQPRHQDNNDTGTSLEGVSGHYYSHTPSMHSFSTKK